MLPKMEYEDRRHSDLNILPNLMALLDSRPLIICQFRNESSEDTCLGVSDLLYVSFSPFSLGQDNMYCINRIFSLKANLFLLHLFITSLNTSTSKICNVSLWIEVYFGGFA